MPAKDLVAMPMGEAFRTCLRLVAASVSLVTARDADGTWHGMAVTSASSLSMGPPSMMVAVKRTASIHPVIAATRHFSLNLMDESHGALLERFSRSDMRDQRFLPEDWVEAGQHGPVLKGAVCAHVCTVAEPITSAPRRLLRPGRRRDPVGLRRALSSAHPLAERQTVLRDTAIKARSVISRSNCWHFKLTAETNSKLCTGPRPI